MMPSLDKLAAWTRHYATLQGVGDYQFHVSIVPGLTHEGVDAWAVVQPDPASRTATVRVRDIDSTPIPGFDGDPLFEIRVTLSHEIFHVLLAEWLADPTVENEERVVESAAQAVLRAELGDARIVARSIKAIPTAIRARVATKTASARVHARARGGTMDQEQVQGALDALETNDAEKAKEILKQMLAALAVKGAGGTPEPSGGQAPPGREPPSPGGPQQMPAQQPEGRTYGREDEQQGMSRARAALDAETARARKGADMTVATGIRARLREVRNDGLELDAKLEAELSAMRDPDAFEQRISDLQRGRAMAQPGQQRARSGVGHDGAPPPSDAGAPMTADALAKEGFTSQFIADYQREHRADPRAAAAMLDGGRAARARKAASAGRGN